MSPDHAWCTANVPSGRPSSAPSSVKRAFVTATASARKSGRDAELRVAGGPEVGDPGALQPEGERVAIRVVDAHPVAVAPVEEHVERVVAAIGRVGAGDQVGTPSDPARVDGVRRRVALARVVERPAVVAEPAPEVADVRQVVVVQRSQQPRIDQPGQHVDHREHDVEVARGVLQPRDRLVDVREALDLDRACRRPRAPARSAREHIGREIVLPLETRSVAPRSIGQIAREQEARVDGQRLSERRAARGAGGHRAAAAAGRRGAHQRESDGKQRRAPQERPPPDRCHRQPSSIAPSCHSGSASMQGAELHVALVLCRVVRVRHVAGLVLEHDEQPLRVAVVLQQDVRLDVSGGLVALHLAAITFRTASTFSALTCIFATVPYMVPPFSRNRSGRSHQS